MTRIRAASARERWRAHSKVSYLAELLCHCSSSSRSLDGGGFRALLQVHVLHRVLSLTGLQLSDLFDLVVGSGSGGILALALAVRRASLEDCEALFDALPARLTRKKLLQRVIGTRLHEFLFGSAYSVEAYEEVLREFFTAQVSLMADVIRNTTPKVCQ